MKSFTSFLVLSVILFLPAYTDAQYTPGINNNVTLLSNLHEYTTYSNIWGYARDGREYALIGHDAGTSIIDIADPENPVEIVMIPGPTAPGTIWREIKVWNDYAFVVSEHTIPNGFSGVQIIDLSLLPATATLVNNYRWPGVDSTNARAHSVSVDDGGYLYIQGGTATLGEGGVQGGIRILDISDPENPVPVSVHPPLYVHDTFIRDTLLFASNIFEGGHMEILSVADRANPVLVHTLTYPNGFSHNSWATEDGNFLLSTDEIVGLTMKVWDITVLWDADPGNDDQIALVGEYIGDSGSIPHNVYVRGDHAYLSHYLEGAKVLDISDPADPVEVGYYDTHPAPGGSFDGDWGVYPFLPSGNIIVSDVQTGLYVFRFDTVGAGGVEGTVTSASDGRPVAGATLMFIEANKVVTTDPLGFYSLRTSEGVHTLAISAGAFVDDTVVVSIPAGKSITLDMSLDSNLVRIAFSPGSFDVALAPDSMTTRELMIQNTGVGTLTYGLNDVEGFDRQRGSLESLPELAFPHFRSDLSNEPNQLRIGTPDTILVDPLDDLLFGEQPDIHIVTALVTDTDVTFMFEFEDPVDMDSLVGVWSLDTDFDIGTGAHPGGFGALATKQDLGAEYDILVDVPGIFGDEGTANLWIGSNEIPNQNPLFSTLLTIVDNTISFTIPLAELNGDDGNMAAAGVFVHIDSFGQAASLDAAPDIGNATVGIDPTTDLPWLALSRKAGTLEAGEADTVVLTFDASGLKGGENLAGSIILTSNDPFNGEISIPVSLFIEIINSADPDAELPVVYALDQNYPNPFNPSTTISFALPSAGRVRLEIFNLIGQRLATLVEGNLPAGRHSAEWTPSSTPSGVYLYRLESAGGTFTRKMILIQ